MPSRGRGAPSTGCREVARASAATLRTRVNLAHAYYVKQLGLACAIAAALGSSASAQAPAQTQAVPTSLTLDAALARAEAVNPAIVAARARRAMSLAEIAVARERLNPEARVELERETPKEAYGLSVPLELGGKRTRRIAVSNAAARTAEAEIAQTIVEVRAQVRRAYFERLIADARVTLADELRTLATRLRDTAQQRFDAGDAPRLEVLQAQLALAEADNQAIAAVGTATAARTALNALLGFPLDASVTLDTSLDASAAPAASAALAQARSANAELQVLDRRLDEQRARLALARALQTPDVTPEGTITRDAEPEFNVGWRAAVGVTIPIFTRHRAGVALEQATLTQLTAQRDATLARVTGEVAGAAAVADAQRAQYLRYRDQIVPQALEVERLAEDSYRLGQTGIAAYLLALQSSRDVRLRSLEAVAGFQNALSDLERAVGAPLP
jgi:outer membrane protein, heavy metal efflux system